ncbi:hypothetical protein FPANT_13023 [Fusarium pseudoanthophilum]|uniref:Uncharacterized protein n=1 Tax=Fusarium pseudoanthophilum TaxID=48495 RepID=A0A8H5KID0_9HYPO|nr:hypothetical protein FPANT_13023 [Fusarium pseudoanthophilum]
MVIDLTNFSITFSALTYASQCTITTQDSFKALREDNLRSLTRAHFEYKAVCGVVCATIETLSERVERKMLILNLQLALFGCEAFKAAVDDLRARHLMKFARHEVEALKERAEKKDEKNEAIVALKDLFQFVGNRS